MTKQVYLPKALRKFCLDMLSFSDNINTNDSVLRIMKFDYDIPFTSNPPSMCMSNNKSALRNYSFVSTSIQEQHLS